MRALALILVLLTVATSAAGAPRPRSITAAPPRPALRGAQSPPATPPVALAAAAPSLASVTPPDAGECRRACSRAYYFCTSDSSAEDCGPTWGQCRSDCAAPNFSGLRAR